MVPFTGDTNAPSGVEAQPAANNKTPMANQRLISFIVISNASNQTDILKTNSFVVSEAMTMIAAKP